MMMIMIMMMTTMMMMSCIWFAGQATLGSVELSGLDNDALDLETLEEFLSNVEVTL